ncbi:MAG TPA: FkbM family methyltransferase [Solirubrobacterales bacterium]|nr:FkbM family methyltransferase [Solirubrobacterales bacterium]
MIGAGRVRVAGSDVATWGVGELAFEDRLFERAIRRGATVVDAGAGGGYHTLLAARRVGPRGRVLAFEPDPEDYRALRRNVRRNGVEQRVLTLPLGLGEWADRRPFYRAPSDGNRSTHQNRWWEAPDTQSTSLDAQIGGCGIDVVRLDVGGAELEALRGMKLTVELCPELRLFVNCDPEALWQAGTSTPMLLEELTHLGFDVRAIDDRAQELLPAGSWLWKIGTPMTLLCERLAS